MTTTYTTNTALSGGGLSSDPEIVGTSTEEASALVTRKAQRVPLNAHANSVSTEDSKKIELSKIDLDGVPDSLRSNWPLLAQSKLPRAAFERLLHLSQIAAARPEGSRMNSGSLRSFLSFWASVRKHQAPGPDLTISSAGNIVAEWHRSWTQHLDVEFRSDGWVLFGLFNGKEILQGREPVEALESRVLPAGKWVFR